MSDRWFRRAAKPGRRNPGRRGDIGHRASEIFGRTDGQTPALTPAYCPENGMDCCCQGHALAPRHWTWGAAPTSVNAMLAGEVGPRGGTAAAQAVRRPLLRSTFCASPSRSMSIRMAARPGSREKRRRTTTTSRAPCGRHRLRWHTWPTCRTVPSLTEIRQAFSPRCAPPSRDSSTRTISSV
jgi:hypothetical protein